MKLNILYAATLFFSFNILKAQGCSPNCGAGASCYASIDCLSGSCVNMECTAPPPCVYVNCGSGGICINMSDTEASCRCENTFEKFLDSKGKPYCGCPEGTTFDADVNRCLTPPTMAPTKAPTKEPTMAPTSSPTSAQTEVVCTDDEFGSFFLDIDIAVGCDWLTKNSAKEEKRKNRYCYRHEVKTLCPLTCDFCECADDSTYTFTLVKTGNTVDCSWLTQNESKMDNRIANYCTEDFDGGFLLDACTVCSLANIRCPVSTYVISESSGHATHL